MIHATIVGKLWGELEDRITTTGQSLITATLSYQDTVTKKYQYVRLCLWGDRFNKIIPFLRHGTTLFTQGVLLINTYFSKHKEELTVSLSMNVDSLQIIFNPFHKINKEEKVNNEESQNIEETPVEREEEKKKEEEEDLDWGGAVFSN